MSHIRTLRIDRIYKEFDGSNVITSNKNSTGLLNAISNQCEWQRSFSQITTRLLLAIIWIEVNMATWLPHSITFNRIGNQQQQEQNWCIQLTNAHKDGWLPIKKQPPKSKPIHMYVCIYILLLL